MTAAALQAALRRITETLARELACPTPAVPDWSDLEWTLAVAVAAMHGVSPLLARVLRWQGPRRWVTFLDEQRAHTANRHARILELLQRIDARARDAAVPAVALKGAALHAMGLYAAGERPMADVDLFVRPCDAQRAVRMLEALSYHESFATPKERVFTPVAERSAAALGEHSSNDIKIELHERICETLPRRTTDISEFIFPAEPRLGLNAYPSQAALMMHLLLHASGAMVIQSLRLVQLHDLRLLSSRMSAADWDEVLDWRTRARSLWWALPPLRLMLRYYGSMVPPNVLHALEFDCPWHLSRAYRRRTLSDVSYSHLWVDAFPGIEWSQTVPEMLRYTLSRIRPSAQHLALRNRVASTQAWASHGRWLKLSQTQRILSWVTSRQARPVTMHVVRAALERAQ